MMEGKNGRPIGAGLYNIGIPHDNIIKYETAVKSGKYLLIAHSTVDEIAKAKEIVDTSSPTESFIHHE